MARGLRIVNYAVNGSGVGHLQRLVAISRWLRRYAAHAGVRAEIYFLTSSEADGLLFHERFASFKLPSKTAVTEAGLDKLAYLALAKQWVWHSLGLLRPDLLVVDTFPRGSFGELLSALDLVARKAFVYRPMKAAFAERADFQAMLPLYDAILVPDHDDGTTRVPEAARARLHHTGPVMARERVELLPRAEARARLALPEGELAVYVSAGGGGDPGAEAQLHEVARVLLGEPGLHLVVGAGPLYRGRAIHDPRVRWLVDPAAAELMAGVDLAVCAAGYNTFFELMHAGVPAVWVPQDKIADEQDVRAARAVAAGAAVQLARGELSAGLSAAVRAWRDPAARARAAEAARALVPRNHARELAAELLRLVLPEHEVAAAEAAVTDSLLEAARGLGGDLEPFLTLMHALAPEGAAATPEHATRLLEDAAARGLPPAEAVRLVELFLRRLPAAPVAERARAGHVLLAALSPFSDWHGALVLLRMLGAERELGPLELSSRLGGFLGRLHGRGEDLYRGIALLSAAQAGGASTNRELLERAP